MLNLLESATKIVFLLLAITACVALFIGKLEAKDFMLLATSCFSFYFAYKGTDKTESTGTQPFAGK